MGRGNEPGAPTFGQVGERGVLAAIAPVLARQPVGSVLARQPVGWVLLGPGDDAAVVAAPDRRVVISTDMLVEGHDFLPQWSTGRDVGVKAAGQNLADIAAMGAVPTGLVVALGAPPDTPVAWAVQLAEGLVDGCADSGAAVVGGDLSAAPVLTVTVTVIGDLQGRQPVTRAGARPGDRVAWCGVLGRAAAGLALLRAGGGPEGDSGAVLPPDLVAELVGRQVRPRPPVSQGPVAAIAGATAMIDVSDGLLRDAGRIAAASGVDILLDGDCATLRGAFAHLREVAEQLTGRPEHAWEWVLGGGEDHGLLCCLPATGDLPSGFSVIGRVVAGSGHARVQSASGHPPVPPGWDHFRA